MATGRIIENERKEKSRVCILQAAREDGAERKGRGRETRKVLRRYKKKIIHIESHMRVCLKILLSLMVSFLMI